MLRALLVLITFVIHYSFFIILFVIHFLRILSLHVFYDCITIIGHSKGELGTINTLYSPLSIPTPLQNCHIPAILSYVTPNKKTCMYVCML